MTALGGKRTALGGKSDRTSGEAKDGQVVEQTGPRRRYILFYMILKRFTSTAAASDGALTTAGLATGLDRGLRGARELAARFFLPLGSDQRLALLPVGVTPLGRH